MTDWPADIPVHPAAGLFPLMDEADLNALALDIAATGLRMPIVRDPLGRILYGRNRYLACQRSGVPVRSIEETGEPWQYVISTNVHRRHLTVGQRALIAATIADRGAGRPAKTSPDEPVLVSRGEAARMLDVSRSQIDRARHVNQAGTQELKTLVAQGKVPITTAARVATTLTATEQNQFVRKVAGGANPRHAAPPDQRPADLIEGSGQLGLTRGTPLLNKPLAGTARIRHRVNTLDADTIARLVASWDGYAYGLADITGIDPAATVEQRHHWDQTITKTVRALTKFRKIIRETEPS